MDEKDIKIRPVVSITPKERQPNQNAIEMLEGMIKRVKDGDVDTVGIAYTTKGGNVGGDVSIGSNNFLMWASLEHLARTFYTDTVLGDA